MEKAYRIKKNTEIEQILKGKNSVGNRNYVIYIKKNHETNHFRLGMSVSKKIGKFEHIIKGKQLSGIDCGYECEIVKKMKKMINERTET